MILVQCSTITRHNSDNKHPFFHFKYSLHPVCIAAFINQRWYHRKTTPKQATTLTPKGVQTHQSHEDDQTFFGVWEEAGVH